MSRNYEVIRQIELDTNMGEQRGAVPSVPPTRSRPEIPRDVKRPEVTDAALSEIDKLVMKLFNPADAKRVMVFAAIESGVPNSICAATASVLSSHVRGSVCVLDANFEYPHIAEYFRIENNGGLANVLTQSSSLLQVAHRASDVDLTTIAAGAALRKELLVAESLKACVAELRREFDFVLIDAPPLMSSSAALALSSESDGLLLIVEADSDSREQTKKVQLELQQAGVTIVGAILNNRKFPIPERIYAWVA